MPISINGTGTITGISAGGLPDDCITTADIAGSAVTTAKLAQPLTLATAQASTSGTAIDFTGIPSWAKRITAMLNAVSVSGTSNLQVQIGSATFSTSGYGGGWMIVASNGLAAAGSPTSGAVFDNTITAAELTYSNLTITNITGNSWSISGFKSTSLSRNGCFDYVVTIGGTLDRVRITTLNGSDTFDAGSINIIYEG